MARKQQTFTERLEEAASSPSMGPAHSAKAVRMLLQRIRLLQRGLARGCRVIPPRTQVDDQNVFAQVSG
jgi:hypothetical protein